MNMRQTLHPAVLKAPFYQQHGGAGLHRYLEADFINRFRQELTSGQFNGTNFRDWQQEEQHSRWDNRPVLRLPTHRTFHLVCCEAACQQLGQPAIDPQKIASAGFVIRRITPEGEQAWILEDGDPLGWQPAPDHQADPDLDRRLRASGLLGQRRQNAAYTGEQTHPMHAIVTRDDQGKNHTLLYGYLPLGGFRYHRDSASATDAGSLAEASEYEARALPWPFGSQHLNGNHWQDNDAEQVTHGKPSPAFLALLRVLVERYQLGDQPSAENRELEELCAGIRFYDSHYRYPGQTLLDYLKTCFRRSDNPLVKWLDEQEDRSESGLEAQRLPDTDGHGSLYGYLRVSEEQAFAFRDLLGQRYRQLVQNLTREIPVPKFGEGEHDLYRIIPFLRTEDACGREQVVWGEDSSRSIPFRVASPLDPEASRPSPIPVPGMRDLKRGMAKGASLLTPSDTFAMLQRLRPKKGINKDLMGGEVPESGLQWILVFSLPVITLVAMILLMVMVTLLNIVFFWLPWVKILIPFPKINR